MDTLMGNGIRARIPGHGSFTLTREAATMIEVLGGLLYSYQGNGGYRKQGLYFSRTGPKKPLRCLLNLPGGNGTDTSKAATPERNRSDEEGITISFSRELAPKLDGAVLDFGSRGLDASPCQMAAFRRRSYFSMILLLPVSVASGGPV